MERGPPPPPPPVQGDPIVTLHEELASSTLRAESTPSESDPIASPVKAPPTATSSAQTPCEDDKCPRRTPPNSANSANPSSNLDPSLATAAEREKESFPVSLAHEKKEAAVVPPACSSPSPSSSPSSSQWRVPVAGRRPRSLAQTLETLALAGVTLTLGGRAFTAVFRRKGHSAGGGPHLLQVAASAPAISRPSSGREDGRQLASAEIRQDSVQGSRLASESEGCGISGELLPAGKRKGKVQQQVSSRGDGGDNHSHHRHHPVRLLVACAAGAVARGLLVMGLGVVRRGVLPCVGFAASLMGILGAEVVSDAAGSLLRLAAIASAVVDPLAWPVPRALRPCTASLLRALRMPAVMVVACGVVLRETLPGMWRTLRFWKRMLPIYFRYLATQHALRNLPLHERHVRWEERHEWGGEQVYRLVLELSGFYVKSAQVLASKTDFMPGPWVRRLSALFDSVPPRPYAEVRASIEQELLRTPLAAHAFNVRLGKQRFRHDLEHDHDHEHECHHGDHHDHIHDHHHQQQHQQHRQDHHHSYARGLLHGKTLAHNGNSVDGDKNDVGEQKGSSLEANSAEERVNGSWQTGSSLIVSGDAFAAVASACVGQECEQQQQQQQHQFEEQNQHQHQHLDHHHRHHHQQQLEDCPVVRLHIHDVFKHVDEDALAAASIAQVHTAQLWLHALVAPPPWCLNTPRTSSLTRAATSTTSSRCSHGRNDGGSRVGGSRDNGSSSSSGSSSISRSNAAGTDVDSGGDICKCETDLSGNVVAASDTASDRARAAPAAAAAAATDTTSEGDGVSVGGPVELSRQTDSSSKSTQCARGRGHEVGEGGGEGTVEVVVKVQHMGMEGTMAWDLHNIGHVATFLKTSLPFDLSTIVEEIQTTIPLEFDFLREKSFLTRITAVLKDNGFADRIVCPGPVEELCTERMIVMQRLYGVPFTRILDDCSRRPTGTTTPDTACASSSSSSGSSSSSSGSSTPASGDSPLLAPAKAAVLDLLRAYGAMFFWAGVFHADPHPGNLLLLPSGQLGLLDFGQSKAMDAATQLQLARIVVAIAEGDEFRVASALTAAGFQFGDLGEHLATQGEAEEGARKLGEGVKDPLTVLIGGSEDGWGISSSGSGLVEGCDSELRKAGGTWEGTLHTGLPGGASGAVLVAEAEGDEGAAGNGPVAAAARATAAARAAAAAGAVSTLAKIAYILFDTRYVAEATVSPMSQDSILRSAPLTAFNKSLWLVVRSILLIRGTCHSLGIDMSAAVMWAPSAREICKKYDSQLSSAAEPLPTREHVFIHS